MLKKSNLAFETKLKSCVPGAPRESYLQRLYSFPKTLKNASAIRLIVQLV